MSLLYGNEVSLDQKTLDYLWQRQNITVNNIANVDTPKYKSQYLTFEDTLASKIRLARKGTVRAREAKEIDRAIRHTTATVHTTDNETSRLDGNNVDMDQEQVSLAKTAYEYQMMVNSVSGNLKRLDAATKF
uniref:flagellar basal body rod protein FlgB n=1 Tax=Eubacterium cellulosolvens TaxID=29322 RepID=UPI00048278F0|nr:flagellar basal body rod protein FlgB [[Eubacterium] cellulosolvens]